jgi:MFS family permease
MVLSNIAAFRPSQENKIDRTGLTQSFVFLASFYFIYSMAIGCILPFLPLYYRSLGHGGAIIGMIGSISPFTSFLVGPLWGIVADKVQNPFFVLYLTSIMSLIAQLLVFVMDDPWHIMIMVCVTSLFSTPIKPLIDSLVMRLLSDRSQFGKLKMFSILGSGVATSVVGRFLKDGEDRPDQLSSHEVDYLISFWGSLTGFKALFFGYAALHVPTFFCIRYFQILYNQKMHQTEETRKNKVRRSLRIKDVLAIIGRDKTIMFFFSLVYTMGISAGFGENFVYVRFKEVGATGKEMGLSRLLSSIGGAIMFWHSGRISSALGMERVMALSFLIVSIRFTLIYLMDYGYFAGYMAETFRGSTFGFFWSTATVYASALAPEEVQVTMVRGSKTDDHIKLCNDFLINSEASILKWGIQWYRTFYWSYNWRESTSRGWHCICFRVWRCCKRTSCVHNDDLLQSIPPQHTRVPQKRQMIDTVVLLLNLLFLEYVYHPVMNKDECTEISLHNVPDS